MKKINCIYKYEGCHDFSTELTFLEKEELEKAKAQKEKADWEIIRLRNLAQKKARLKAEKERADLVKNLPSNVPHNCEEWMFWEETICPVCGSQIRPNTNWEDE